MATSTLNINVRTDKAERNVTSLDRKLNRLDRTGNKVSGTFRGMGGLMAAAVVAGTLLAARAVQKLGDEYTVIQNKLRLVTKDQEELLMVQSKLAQISADTRTNLLANATAFQRLTVASESLNLTTQQMLTIQEALALSFKISGSTAQEAASSSIQLAQGLGAGALRGDEFRSIAEGNVTLLQLLAKELNVNVGQLKDLAGQGKITSDVVANALGKNIDSLREKFKLVSPTIDESMSVLRDSFTIAVGAMNDGTNAGGFFSQIIIRIAEIIRNSQVHFIQLGALFAQIGVRVMEVAKNIQNFYDLINTLGQIDIFGGEAVAQFDAAVAAYMEQMAAIRATADEKSKLITMNAVELSSLIALQKGLTDTVPAYEAVEGAAADVVETQKLMVSFADGAADAFIAFAEGAEDSFSDFAKSFLRQIAKMIIQQQILNALQGVTGLFSPIAAAGSATPLMATPIAKGAAFAGGNIVPFARGGVVSKPTLFPMANGAGLMGEAGPEAILPLTRGKGGKLGVQGTGSGVVVNIINNSDSDITQNVSDDGARVDIIIESVMHGALAGGKFDRTLNTNFGISRSGF